MSKSVTFLGLAAVGWIGFRAMSLGLYPGALAHASEAPSAPPQPVTAFVPPMAQPQAAYPPMPSPYGGWPSYIPYPVAMPAQRISYPVFAQAPYAPPAYPPAYFGYSPPWGYASPPTTPLPTAAAQPPLPSTTPALPQVQQPKGFDHWQVASWAIYRPQLYNGSTPSLAPNGMLGGSQAGTRVLYRFDPRLAASARLSSPLGGTTRGSEAALGLRYQPFPDVPLAITAERREAIGTGGGRSAFALFAEAGAWDVPLPYRMRGDAYLQAGIVGADSRDLFIEGGATMTRPILWKLEGGLGAWGGVQPGLGRLDVGPRLSLPVKDGWTLHADWRQKVAGNAAPDSGPALSFAADF